MGLLDWLWGASEPEPATDFQLQDGSGVVYDPDTGAAVAGYILPEPSCYSGAYVAPYGHHSRGDYDEFITQPAPDGWQDQVVRAWRS